MASRFPLLGSQNRSLPEAWAKTKRPDPFDRSADRALKRLIGAGVLEVVRAGEPRRGGKATEYRFLEDARGKQ